ncbi:DNA ligase 4-like isoform X1 [Salvia splendens]|uniref:DNA ligase 4-like isoform X1 n=1 Tax=Salvia splendens TaxID=180675 RepID=UPI001C26B6ED|nr:DNA ligase 4-like isoform X1 [Salvia splendens]
MSAIKFSVMVSLFNWMQKSKSSSIKRSKFRKFLDTFCRPKNGADYFAAIRLILPALDRERGSYGLREHVLATCLIDALGISRDSPDSQRLLNWRKGGAKSGAFAGNFALVAAEVLQRRQGMSSGELTILELNELLDRLSTSDNRSEKIYVLSELIRKTNVQEMKWIIMIILKDLKLGISEKSIFHEFHPDAEDLFNVTCDLKLVCEKLQDHSQRHKRQDIEVGKPVRPQLALRVSNAAAAWKKLHGKEVVVECKFDGDRIQIHKNGADINFFSRNFLDHPEYGYAMSDIIRENILVDRCILDGEMLVWDKSANRFAEFGSNQEIAKAAKDGLDTDRQLCYVAFDILYAGDTSVIHQSLKERHQLLQQFVKPIAGCLEILVPNGGLNTHRPAGEPCWSLIVHDVDGIERFFKETIDNRDEGIVLKDLSSKWEPSDRSAKWMKLKPDYIRAGSDLDVLIIGGYYGSGRHGGEVAQFLVGLAERPSPNAYPKRFLSFCRVGTGLSDEELSAVVTKLKPYFRKYEYPKKLPPNFYQVTNNSKERPDVWVESPEKSIIVSITSDIRTIRSEVFTAPYSLRFPRIDRVRYDKPWHECLDVQSFVELVHSSNGTMQRAMDDTVIPENNTRRKKLSRGTKKNVSVVPSHFIQTDVSGVKGETSIFSNMIFYFVNVPILHSLDSLHKLVVENGGTFSMNLNSSVTHCIASESKGIKFQAAKRQGDVIHYSWLLECCTQKQSLPLHPKYFLFLSDETKKKLEEEVDEFSDSYFLDLNVTELEQILNNINKIEDSEAIEYCKKFCPREEWVRFHGCHVYFHLPMQFSKYRNCEVPFELAIRRMKVEICTGGGSIADTLSHATHLVIVCSPELGFDFDTLLNSFSEAQRLVLHRRSLQIVKSQWLDDCFERNQKLPEDIYNLKPLQFQQVSSGESDEHKHAGEENDSLSRDASSSFGGVREENAAPHKPRVVSLPDGVTKRRRGGPSGTSTGKRKPLANLPRKTRPRATKKPAKISDYESDNDASSGDKAHFEVRSTDCGSSAKVDNRKRAALNQPRRARAARLRNKPVEINDNESDEGAAAVEEKTTVGNFKPNPSTNERLRDTPSQQPVPDLHQTEVVEGSIPDTGKAVEQEIAEPSEYIARFDKSGVGQSSSKNPGEEYVDPVQSMLLSMLPGLATNKVESMGPVREEAGTRAPDPVNEEYKVGMDAENKAVKKRKVSYKDMASELLKDW